MGRVRSQASLHLSLPRPNFARNAQRTSFAKRDRASKHKERENQFSDLSFSQSRRKSIALKSVAEKTEENPKSDEMTTDPISEPIIPRYLGKKAIVVGAGPAGTVASDFLARHGFRVKIYEKRGDPQTTPDNDFRPIIVAIRGKFTTNVLKEFGMDLPTASDGYKNALHRYERFKRFDEKGTLMTNEKVDDYSFVGSRQAIADSILLTLRKKYTGSMEFHFDHTCTNVDYDEQEVTFVDQNGKSVNEKYDLLIASDGTNSIIRDTLKTRDDSFTVDSVSPLTRYKSIQGIKPPLEKDAESSYIPGDLMTTVTKRVMFKGKSVQMAIFYAINEKGNIVMNFFSKEAMFDAIEGNEEEWLKQAAPDHFPSEWISPIAEKLKSAQLNRLPKNTLLSKLIGPKTILIGDAGHSYTPSIGMGARQAIVDTRFLNEALKQAKGDIDEAVTVFNTSRIDDIRNTIFMDRSVFTPENTMKTCWARFLGYVHFGIFAPLSRIIRGKKWTTVFAKYRRMEITAGEAVNIMKRDGILFLCVVFLGSIFFIQQLIKLMTKYIGPRLVSL